VFERYGPLTTRARLSFRPQGRLSPILVFRLLLRPRRQELEFALGNYHELAFSKLERLYRHVPPVPWRLRHPVEPYYTSMPARTDADLSIFPAMIAHGRAAGFPLPPRCQGTGSDFRTSGR